MWFWKVHRGHSLYFFADAVPGVSVDCAEPFAPSVTSEACAVPDALLDSAAIADFIINASGGLTPQAWHGGRGVCSFAADASKLGGTGFESAQTGQIHVAFRSLSETADWRDFLLAAEPGLTRASFGDG
jgi:hypothetical protein